MKNNLSRETNIGFAFLFVGSIVAAIVDSRLNYGLFVVPIFYFALRYVVGKLIQKRDEEIRKYEEEKNRLIDTFKCVIRKDDAVIFETLGEMYFDGNGQKYYHVPFWLREVSDNYFEVLSEEDLPTYIKELANKKKIA